MRESSEASASSGQTGLVEPPTADTDRLLEEVRADLGPRYEVLDYLGRGAFATVWKAHDRLLGQLLAVKRFDVQRARTRSFYRELSILFRLEQPRIVRVVNLLEVEKVHYLFLEYCAGGSLRASIGRARRARLAWPPERVRELAIQLLEGLAAAHRLGLVHRDLKPENVLFESGDDTPFGGSSAVKLADFGLARALQQAGFREREGEALRPLSGSPAYMAPEQFGGSFGPASDLYALGVILYELLHGRRPFQGGPSELARLHLHQPPEIRSDLPRPWPALLASLLEKLPERRLPSAEAALAQLRGTPSGSTPPADRKARCFAHCLGVYPFALAPLRTQKGRVDFVAVSGEGLFRFRSDTGALAGFVPLTGLHGATATGGSLWLFQGRKLLRLHPDNRVELVAQAPGVIDALAGPIPGQPDSPLLLLAEEELLEVQPGEQTPIRSLRRFRRQDLPAAVVRLPDGGLACAVGPQDPCLLLLDAAAATQARIPLPGPCRHLSLGPEPETLSLGLVVEGGLAHYRMERTSDGLRRLDGPELVLLAEDAGGARSLYGLTDGGDVVCWLPTGASETVLRFAAPGAKLWSLAVDGGFAALGSVRDACWIYLRGEGTGQSEGGQVR